MATVLLRTVVDGVVLDQSLPSFAQMVGTMMPKYTTTQRDALVAGEYYIGMVIYNTTTNKLNVRVAAAWEAVTSA